jgi:hypothetical protein
MVLGDLKIVRNEARLLHIFERAVLPVVRETMWKKHNKETFFGERESKPKEGTGEKDNTF